MTILTEQQTLPGFLLERTAKLLKLSFQRKLKQLDAPITADQWVVLHTLFTSGSMPQVSLSLSTAKDAPTLTRMIDLMVEKGFITRHSDPEDARRWIIDLTHYGRELVDELLPAVILFRERSYQGIDPHQLNQLKESLDIISQNLEL